jgi:hypothetical protein
MLTSLGIVKKRRVEIIAGNPQFIGCGSFDTVNDFEVYVISDVVDGYLKIDALLYVAFTSASTARRLARL